MDQKRDQADTLRRLMRERMPTECGGNSKFWIETKPPAKVLTISSGKGGVGKSCITANLGAQLARSGLRVLMVDGDFGLANLDILLGVQAQCTIEEVLAGEARLQDAIVGVEPNLWLVPSASGLMDCRTQDLSTRARIISLLEQCPWEMDVILLDIGAGIHSQVLSLHSPLFQSLVVLTPEPTSLTDAYGLIKCLRRHSGVVQVSVIVNQVTDGREARSVFQKLKDVASRFLDVQIEYLGHWERDEKITQSVMKRKILLDLDPGARSIPSLELLAKQVRTRLLGLVDEELQKERHEDAVRVSSRYQLVQEELATGNTLRFWRTFLGVTPSEVKA